MKTCQHSSCQRRDAKTPRRQGKTGWVWLTLVVVTICMTGCGGHPLAGKIVSGPASQVLIVDKADARLLESGIPGASVSMVLDPGAMRPIEAGTVMAGEDGMFEMSTDALGAGLLEYELGVEGRARGYESVWQLLPKLPGRSQRLLIVLTPGRDTPARPKPIVDESLEIGEKWMNP